MLTQDFIHKIREMDRRFWIDVDRVARVETGYPTQGLYFNEKFVMAVPYGEITEYSIAGCDFNKMLWQGRQDLVNEVIETGYVPPPYREKILTRGWRIILQSLVLSGYLRQDDTEKKFNIKIEPKRKDMPRVHIQMDL